MILLIPFFALCLIGSHVKTRLEPCGYVDAWIVFVGQVPEQFRAGKEASAASDKVRKAWTSFMEDEVASLRLDHIRTLLGAPGLTTRSKKLLGAPGIATRSKDAPNGSQWKWICDSASRRS